MWVCWHQLANSVRYSVVEISALYFGEIVYLSIFGWRIQYVIITWWWSHFYVTLCIDPRIICCCICQLVFKRNLMGVSEGHVKYLAHRRLGRVLVVSFIRNQHFQILYIYTYMYHMCRITCLILLRRHVVQGASVVRYLRCSRYLFKVPSLQSCVFASFSSCLS